MVDGLSEREAGLQESGKTTEKSATEPRESDETNEKKTSEKDESGEKERGGGEVKQVELEEGEERTPIPPPRRKRKKKLQKNPSLEDLEVHISTVYIHTYIVRKVYLCSSEVPGGSANTALHDCRQCGYGQRETDLVTCNHFSLPLPLAVHRCRGNPRQQTTVSQRAIFSNNSRSKYRNVTSDVVIAGVLLVE